MAVHVILAVMFVCVWCVLHQRDALQQQFEELGDLVRSYRKRVGQCPISGRGKALDEELEKMEKVNGIHAIKCLDTLRSPLTSLFADPRACVYTHVITRCRAWPWGATAS